MKIKNKHRFYLGAGIFGCEILAGSICGLSYANFSWISVELAKIVSVGLGLLLMNLFAFWLVKDGSEDIDKTNLNRLKRRKE